MIEAKEEYLAELKSKMDSLMNQTIPQQLKDLASLKISHIVHGDYDLKIARQKYYIAKQEEVIY